MPERNMKDLRQARRAGHDTENLMSTTKLIHDVMRYFHGDAQLRNLKPVIRLMGIIAVLVVEHTVHAFDDLAYCFCAHRPTLTERQEFILQGEAWIHS